MNRGAKGAPIGSSNSRQYLRRGYWRGKSKYETTNKIKRQLGKAFYDLVL